jgi:hypothetical protein
MLHDKGCQLGGSRIVLKCIDLAELCALSAMDRQPETQLGVGALAWNGRGTALVGILTEMELVMLLDPLDFVSPVRPIRTGIEISLPSAVTMR